MAIIFVLEHWNISCIKLILLGIIIPIKFKQYGILIFLYFLHFTFLHFDIFKLSNLLYFLYFYIFFYLLIKHPMLILKRFLVRPSNHRKLRKLKSPAQLTLDIVQFVLLCHIQIALSFLVYGFPLPNIKVQFRFIQVAQHSLCLPCSCCIIC